MTTFLTILFVFVCLFLITVILLQSGRGGGLGGIGGSAGQQVFGGAGGSRILPKITGASAALFMILAVTLAYLSSRDEAAFERVEDRIDQAAAPGAADEESGGSVFDVPELSSESEDLAPADESASDDAPENISEPGIEEAAESAVEGEE